MALMAACGWPHSPPASPPAGKATGLSSTDGKWADEPALLLAGSVRNLLKEEGPPLPSWFSGEWGGGPRGWKGGGTEGVQHDHKGGDAEGPQHD